MSLIAPAPSPPPRDGSLDKLVQPAQYRRGASEIRWVESLNLLP